MRQIKNFTLALLIFGLHLPVLAQETKDSRHIGTFSREGEYIKDYFILKENGIYHLFTTREPPGVPA